MSSDFWAGYLSGAASIIIGNPLDLVKVRLQAGLKHVQCQPTPTGWSLMAGLPAPVLTYGALNALLYTSYNRTLALLPVRDAAAVVAGGTGAGHSVIQHHPAWAQFVAGAVAGFATFVISAPTEYVKCRAQVAERAVVSSDTLDARRPTTSWGIAKQTIRAHGIGGLYVGGVVTSVRDAVGYGFYFVTYEVSRRSWEQHVTNRRHPGSMLGSDGSGDAMGILLCGGLAGVATWASIFPLDVIKTRVQTQNILTAGEHLPPLQARMSQSLDETTPLRNSSAAEPVPTSRRPMTAGLSAYKGAWQVGREIYAHEGISAFWRGIGVCCMRAFVVNAVQWTVYEWVMRSLK